jgi:hypothetical protein
MANWSPTGSAKAIDIVIRGRDEAAAAFDSAAKKAASFSREAGVGLGGFASHAISVAAYARAVTTSLRLASAAVQLYNGDWMTVHETMKQMPLGLGAAYDAFIDLAGAITGANEAIERLEKRWAAIERERRGVAWIRKTEIEVAFQVSQLQRSPVEQQLAEVDRKAQNAQRALREAVRRGFPEWQAMPLAGLYDERRERERREILGKEADREYALADQKHQARRQAEKREAEKMADEATAAAAAVADAQLRTFNATASARDRELAALDHYYAEARERWKGHADVLAAEQDAYNADRATIILAGEREKDVALRDLESELFEATHTQQDVEARRWQEHLAALKEQFADSAEGLKMIDRLAAEHGRKGVPGRDLAGSEIAGQRTYFGRLPPDSPVLESNRLLARLVDLQKQEVTKGDMYQRQIVGAVRATAAPALLVGHVP